MLLGQARAAEAAGYEGFFWGDHLQMFPYALWTSDVTPLADLLPEPNATWDPVAALAAIGATTERLRVGSSVTDAVRRHPATLAQEWLTLHHLTDGRAILGLGAGEAENIVPYGFPFERPMARMEEAIRVIRVLWESTGPVDFDGEFWTLRHAVLGLSSCQGTFPPIWTGAMRPRGLRVTGELADGWMPYLMRLDEYVSGRGLIEAAASRAERAIDDFDWGMVALAVTLEDHEACHRVLTGPLVKWLVMSRGQELFEEYGIDHPLGRGHRGIHDLLPHKYQTNDLLQALDLVPDELCHDLILHGTPDEIAARLHDFESAGIMHVNLTNITPYGGDLDCLEETARLFDELAQQLICAA